MEWNDRYNDGNCVTLFRLCDGEYITWHVSATADIVPEMKSVPLFSVIKITGATILFGYQICIEEFRVKSLRSSLIVSFDRIKFLSKED